MTRISAEQAQKCPRCSAPGEILRTHLQRDQQGRAGKIHTMRCNNLKCNWYATNWVVQEDSEGYVMVRDSGHERKTFPQLATVLTQDEASALVDVLTQGELQDPH